MRTTLQKTDYTEQQINAINRFVKDNYVRLSKQFGNKHIAVEYRDVRGGVVVDSDIDALKLVRRVDDAGYGPLMVRTVDGFINEFGRCGMFLETPELTEATA